MVNDFFTLEGIEYSKEDITKALECLSLNNRTNHKSDNNGEEYSILYKDNRYSVKLIYEQMKINKNLPYKNTLGSTSIRKKFSEYYEVLPCIHSNVNINRLKEEFRKYLNEIYPAGYDKTYEYDPFYLINNSKNTDIKDCCKDRNIYFWKIFENDENLQKYYDVLKEKRSSNTYNSYISSTNRLKNFFIKKYGSYIDWIRSLNEINYYVVSQREHYEEAKQKGIIFSSAKVEHRRMRYLKPNDIILSYVDGINAKLTVLEEPSIDEASNYIEVKVKFEELKTPISREEIRYRLGDLYNYLTQEEYPFAKNKNEKICSIKQRGFLFNFTEEAYNLLFSNEKSNFANKNLEDYRKMNNKNLSFTLPKNQILYGPPGTGKTYNTVIKAMEIINDKKYDSVDDELYKDLKKQFDNLKKQGQIEFVTFHQSYSYEEFVEGIKPDLENGKELRYKLQNGIFKTICNNAKELLETKVKHNFNKDNISVYKILIPDESLFAYCIENDCVAINWGNDIDISNCDSQEEIIAKIPEDFESRKQCISQLNLFKLWIDNDLKSGKDVIVVIPGSMNTIKGIAKITGDYFYNSDIENGHQQRKVDWIRKNINISSDSIYNSKFVSPTITGMFNDKINWDTFLNLINNKNNSKSSNAVLVIDEINRGDVSKIFGELITLIEEDKRIGKEHQMTVTLPYSREPFGVPNNLYIIGTMNTADRSIALLDTALRRRFDFEEMMPKPELLSENIEGVDLEQLLTQINDRIKKDYDRDHQIGHSYLMGVKNKEQLERAYKNRILPLLNEYFYNDIDSVAKVLNCKPDDISSKENWFNVLKEAQKPTKKDNEQ